MPENSVNRRFLLSSLGSGFVAALSGCSGAGGDDTTTDTSESPPETPEPASRTATKTPTTTLTTVEGGAGGGGEDIQSEDAYGGFLDNTPNYEGTTVDRRGQTEVTVRVGESENGNNLGFWPAAVQIDSGATVIFEWAGGDAAHTVRHVDDVFHSGSPVSKTGATYEVRFEQEGIYKYYCEPHRGLGMKGVIAVGPSDKPVSDPNSVTETSGDDGQESGTLAAGDGDDGDKLGYSVAASADGDWVLTGAFRDDDPHGTESGSAYVFQQTSDGWQQAAKLTAPEGNAEDWFGWDVALNADGTTALISAFLADASGAESGAVYAFTRTTDGWHHQSTFTGTETTEADRFGSGVALSADGETAVIGAWRASDKSGTGAGYVFERVSGTWIQQARVTPPTQTAGAAFGRTVAVTPDGTTVLVGADGESAAYLFEQSEKGWQQQRRFTDPTDTDDDERASSNWFGGEVAVADNGRKAFVGTTQPASADNSGYVAVYQQSSTDWTHEAVLRAENGFPGDKFGAALASTATGETLLVGASNSNEYGENSGAATLFQRSTDGWTAEQSLRAFHTDEYDDFGIAVALADDGSTGLIGARDAETEGNGETGAVYLFRELA